MSTQTTLPALLHGFFEEYLAAQRDVSANTIRGYRDGIKSWLGHVRVCHEIAASDCVQICPGFVLDD